jgi:hypothetical protein
LIEQEDTFNRWGECTGEFINMEEIVDFSDVAANISSANWTAVIMTLMQAVFCAYFLLEIFKKNPEPTKNFFLNGIRRVRKS